MTRLPVVIALAAFVACGERSTAPRIATPTPPAAVASVAIEPSAISLGAGQQRTLDATTRDASGAILTGRAVQWQSSAPGVATVSAGGNSASATVVAIAPGMATISASSEGRSASATVTVVAVPAADFAIASAQWTQGAQQADGSIPMVLDGNAAVLNVIMSTTVASRPPGQLVLRLTDASGAVVRTDTVVPAPIDGAVTYDAPTAQFLVPASQLRSGLRWQVRRDPRKVLADADTTNDVFPRAGPANLATVALPAMRIRFVPIVLSAHGNATGNVSAANVEGYLPTMRRVFPLGSLTTSVGTPLVTSASFGTPTSGGSEGFWLQVLSDLDLARVANPGAPDEYWMGVVRPPTGFTYTSFGGFSYVAQAPGPPGTSKRISTVVQVGWFTNTGQTSDLVAHELAHTLGRRHAPCGGATSTDAAFPVSSGTIGTPGHDVYAWANGLASAAVARPATMGDLMGYCFPQWASPYTYAGILQARIASAPMAIASASARIRTRQHVVVVRGQVVDGRISLLPTVALDGVAADGARGAYVVELLTADGRVVASQRTDLEAVDHSDAQTFIAALPLDERAAAELAAVRVSGPAGTVIRRANAATPPGGAGANAEPRASLRALASGELEAVCGDSRAAAIVVQDHDSGVLLASATASRVTLGPTAATSIDISCSDGVHSARSLATRTRR